MATKSKKKPPKKAAATAPTTANGDATPAETAPVELVPPSRKAKHDPLGDIAILLKLVADRSRVTVILMLKDATANVTTMCKHCLCSQPALSHHLAIMRHSGLVDLERDGRSNNYHLTEKGQLLADVIGLMSDRLK